MKYRFMNWTGMLRLSSRRTLYIDTVSTYGFSGELFFILRDASKKEFIGILTRAPRLWNKCILLQQSVAYNSYYKQITEHEREQERLNNNKLEFWSKVFQISFIIKHDSMILIIWIKPSLQLYKIKKWREFFLVNVSFFFDWLNFSFVHPWIIIQINSIPMFRLLSLLILCLGSFNWIGWRNFLTESCQLRCTGKISLYIRSKSSSVV